jgi:DNA-binding response OmpR family regulator
MSARVLIVDDSTTVRRIAADMLRRRGFECFEAIDGRAAIALLQTTPADLVLVDFVMPGMNGFQFCRELRNHEGLRGTPVVLVSAKSHRIRERFIEQTGALDAIGKPFDEGALAAVVENVLRRVRSGVTREPQEITDEVFIEPGNSMAPEAPEESTSVGVAGVLVLRLAEKLAGFCGKTADQLIHELSQRLTPQESSRLLTEVQESEAGIILSGRLPTIPLNEVLNVLQVERHSGRLRMTRDNVEITATFQDGAVALVAARNGPDEFRLGQFLLLDNAIRPEELEQTLQEVSGVPLGTRLLRAGAISELALTRALTKQSSELVYDVLRWRTGRFEFVRETARTLPFGTNLKLKVSELIIEGYRRIEEWQHLERTLGHFDSVLAKAPEILNELDLDVLPNAELSVLNLVDGTRTIRELVAASSAPGFETSRILAQFIAAKMIVRRPSS